MIESRDFNLVTARNEEKIGLNGLLLYVVDIPAGVYASVRFDDLSSVPMPLVKGRQYKLQFDRLFLTNIAQSGTLSIIVSDDPDITIEDTDTAKPPNSNIDSNAALTYDKNLNPIQGALEPKVAQTFALSIASNRIATDFTKKVIKIYSTVDCFYKLGNSTVTAVTTDHFLPAKTIEYIAVGSNMRLAAILSSGTGTLYLSEMG